MGWGRRWLAVGLTGVMAGWLGAVMVAGEARAAAPVPSGFTVAPALAQVVVRADQPTTEYELQLQNHTAVDQNFRLSVVDFGALDEEGGVAFLGTPASELEHTYGLASWMTLEKNAVFVAAGEVARLRVMIENRPSLAPGGHYGAVLATAVTDTGQPEQANRIGLRQVLSSLVLAVKEGGAERELRLVGQTADGTAWRLPGRVEQRYQNVGNVHVVPRGVVAVIDPRGRTVARGAINEGSAVILPETFRRYRTRLLGVAPAWLPGRYRLVATYRYDGMDQAMRQETGFWYVGSLVVWVVGAFAAVAVAGLVVWLWWWRPRRRQKR